MLGLALGRRHRGGTFIFCDILHSTLRQPNIEIGGVRGGADRISEVEGTLFFTKPVHSLPAVGFQIKAKTIAATTYDDDDK